MKKIYLLRQKLALAIALLFFTCYIQAQTNTFPSTGSAGIGTVTPNASSILEMKSISKGMLVPRMTKTNRDAITAPATGLLIYQTNSTPGFYYYASGWKPLKSPWLTSGSDLYYNAGNVGIGTNSPVAKLQVDGGDALINGLTVGIGSGAGTSNTAVGFSALNANVSGVENTANGYQALSANTTGYYNSAYGYRALYSNQDGIGNTANGSRALMNNTSGSNNTAIGHYALLMNGTGYNNVAIGNFSLQENITGFFNTANGGAALGSNTTGNYNTGDGYGALYSNLTGIANTALGFDADVIASNLNNAMALGYNALVNADNKVVVGNSDVKVIGGQVGWSTFSDGRFKTNIQENVPGLVFINKLKPVTYNLDVKKFDKFLNRKNSLINNADEGYAIGATVVHTGFIAQDVEQAAQGLHYDFDGVNHPQNEKDNYSLVYADFVPSLVKAVQELSAKNDELGIANYELKKQNDTQKKINDDLQKQINELKAMIVASNQFNTNNEQPRLNDAVGQEMTNLSSASLAQNIPNPFSNTTTINYILPQNFVSARIIITDQSGKVLKQVNPSGSGKGSLQLNAATLSAGAYQYSLLVDGKLIDTKQMILNK